MGSATVNSSQEIFDDLDLRPGECDVGKPCTTLQVIDGSEIDPIKVQRKPETYVVSFVGNYNCDFYVNTQNFPFVDVELQLGTDDEPFETVSPRTASYVPNAGTDVVLRHVVVLEEGEHWFRLMHRYPLDGQAQTAEPDRRQG